MRHNDAVLNLAMRLLPYFEPLPVVPDHRRTAAMESVAYHANHFQKQLTLLATARVRTWVHAAAQIENSAADSLQRLQYAISEALNYPRRPSPREVTLRDLYEELKQLHEEFDTVRFEEEVLIANTPAIELENVHLGAFSIELSLEKLAQRMDVSCFDVIALDPHPAAGSEETTHPHVQNDKLCAGEATVPISAALRDGRLCDAFLALQAVLNTYNPGSSYVRLEEWDGVPCADCGCTVDPDNRFYCEGCQQDYCDECTNCCDICGRSYCRGCLEKDRRSGLLCCSGCRRECGQCSRIVDSDSFVEETGLCPECHEEQVEQKSHLNEKEAHEHTEEPDRSGECAIEAAAVGAARGENAPAPSTGELAA